MSQLKKVFLKLSVVNAARNARAVHDSMQKFQKKNMERSLRKGYEEMALLNVSLAQMCLESDNDALRACEEKLTECE